MDTRSIRRVNVLPFLSSPEPWILQRIGKTKMMHKKGPGMHLFCNFSTLHTTGRAGPWFSSTSRSGFAVRSPIVDRTEPLSLLSTLKALGIASRVNARSSSTSHTVFGFSRNLFGGTRLSLSLTLHWRLHRLVPTRCEKPHTSILLLSFTYPSPLNDFFHSIVSF